MNDRFHTSRESQTLIYRNIKQVDKITTVKHKSENKLRFYWTDIFLANFQLTTTFLAQKLIIEKLWSQIWIRIILTRV